MHQGSGLRKKFGINSGDCQKPFAYPKNESRQPLAKLSYVMVIAVYAERGRQLRRA
jgi:hypothetical protein